MSTGKYCWVQVTRNLIVFGFTGGKSSQVTARVAKWRPKIPHWWTYLPVPALRGQKSPACSRICILHLVVMCGYKTSP